MLRELFPLICERRAVSRAASTLRSAAATAITNLLAIVILFVGILTSHAS